MDKQHRSIDVFRRRREGEGFIGIGFLPSSSDPAIDLSLSDSEAIKSVFAALLLRFFSICLPLSLFLLMHRRKKAFLGLLANLRELPSA